MTSLRMTTIAAIAAAALCTARPAVAGPPLICFPFDIGNAKSLPMGTHGWHETDPTYNVAHLVDDTVALLGANTPVLVRMETLRRATMYAGKDTKLAGALLAALEARARATQPDVALSVFDFGYLIETYLQAATIFPGLDALVKDADGYGLVRKAYAFRNDPAIDHAASLMRPKRTS